MEKRLQHMKESLVSCVENQLTHLESVDTKELGEAIDMIKDLEEAIYYCTITKAMNEKGEEKEGHYKHYSQMQYRDMDRGMGRMYYEDPRYMGGNDTYRQYSSNGGQSNSGSSSGGSNNSSSGQGQSGGNSGGSSRQYSEKEYELMRDRREGKSPMSRRTYMEAKESHSDKAHQMKELENYMQELTQDVVEMVEGASAEEKQYLSKRVAALANKLAQLND